MDFQEMINSFLETHNFTKDNEHVLGVIFYGSANYQKKKTISDLDILIITNSPKNYKGVIYYKGVKIEYFERNYAFIARQLDHLERSADRSLISIFKNGKILFSRDYSVESLRDQILSLDCKRTGGNTHSHSLLCEWLLFYRELETANNFSCYVYHNLLELIRKCHHEENGCSKLSASKVYDLYNDKEYAEKYFCVKLPSLSFREAYIKAITNNEDGDILVDLVNRVGVDFSKTPNNIIVQYQMGELRYKSTIVETSLSKLKGLYESGSPVYRHLFFLSLEKIRLLYCNINWISESIDDFGSSYDDEFIRLFNECLTRQVGDGDIRKLFMYVTQSLDMDYKEYRIPETSI